MPKETSSEPAKFEGKKEERHQADQEACWKLKVKQEFEKLNVVAHEKSSEYEFSVRDRPDKKEE